MKPISLLVSIFVIFTNPALFAESLDLNLSYTMTVCNNLTNKCESQAPDFNIETIELVAHKKDPSVLVGSWHKQLISEPFTFNAYVDVVKFSGGYKIDTIIDSYNENPIDDLTSVSGGVFVENLKDLNQLYFDGHWQFDLDNYTSYAPTLRIKP